MKYIMLPNHPNWVCSIMNGIKKIEVRSGTRLYNAINRLIKEQGKAPCLMYCTKGKETLAINPYGGYSLTPNKYHNEYFSGKVVAEFEASAEVIYPKEELGAETLGYFPEIIDINYKTDTLGASELLERSCLTGEQIADYLTDDDTNSPIFGTAIHIHNLKIFDKPKELKEFKYICKRPQIRDCEICYRLGGKVRGCHNGTNIDKAPQSFMFCEVRE